MTDLLFCFDTEDFVTPEAMDAQKWWAEELRARGLRGTFHIVAEVLRAHRRRGREDVTEALARHDISYHTNTHSLPPAAPVAIEGMNLAEGIAWVHRREAAGWALLTEVFGRVPIGYCVPGDSWTPQSLLAFAAMGARACCVSVTWDRPRPCWYAGLLNFDYHLAFESVMDEGPDLERTFRERFAALRAQKELLCLCTHPTRLVTTCFWDKPLYHGANPRDIPPAPLRTREQVAVIKDRVRRLLDWLQKQPDLRFIDMSTACGEYAAGRVDLQALLDRCRLNPAEAGRLPLREPEGVDPAARAAQQAFRYGWPLYPEGFTGAALRTQMRQLLWTFAPAQRVAPETD